MFADNSPTTDVVSAQTADTVTKKRVKQSHYRPGMSQRVPAS